MPSASKGNAKKKWNQNWMMAGVVFVQVAVQQIKFSLKCMSLRNLKEYAKDVFACFVDLEKACDWVPRVKLGRLLQEYGIDGRLLMVIKSLLCQVEACDRINNQSHFMWMLFFCKGVCCKLSRTNKRTTIGR